MSTALDASSNANGGGSYFANQTADDDFDDFDPRGTSSAAAGNSFHQSMI